jgi:hypothetical protein
VSYEGTPERYRHYTGIVPVLKKEGVQHCFGARAGQAWRLGLSVVRWCGREDTSPLRFRYGGTAAVRAGREPGGGGLETASVCRAGRVNRIK